MAEPNGPLLTSMTIEGFLSFGDATDIRLEPLNVVIGPNGSGKSNLVEAMAVLRAVPRDLPQPIREGGRSVWDWLWRPDPSSTEDAAHKNAQSARIEVVFTEGRIAQHHTNPAVRYRLVFGAQGDSFVVLDERLENADRPSDKEKPYFYFGYEHGRPMLNVRDRGRGSQRELRRETLDMTQSILSQRRDPEEYPELGRLTDALERIRIYRRWQFGPDAKVREACSPSVRADHLSENFDNLPARLAVLKRDPLVKRRLLELLRELAPGFNDFEVVPEGGLLTLYLVEGDLSVPARRISDGTLRFLCLLAILVDPKPPPFIVIEEPELGLHPDIHSQLASLLLDASSRTQLIVTTHSDILVDALTGTPESIVVCEKVRGCTALERLSAERLEPWLDKYRLGELWLRGEIGGTRW
ncbi:AAA family ATPase [Candidatus Palauibacter sp.]|uniref:AAA family ATPase n=1 Tax=Candidatus Palauibacter sp. TaxID=3101350 RepID=UPI003D0F5C81